MLTLTNEILLQGFVALIMLLVAFRDVMKNKKAVLETSTVASPMVAAMSITWDRNQQERFLQLFEELVVAHKLQTIHLQGIQISQDALADQEKADMSSKIDEVLRQLNADDRAKNNRQKRTGQE